MRKISKVLSLLLVFAMIVPGLAQAAPVNGEEVITRLAGAGRWETAAKVSKEAFKDGSEYVVIASGRDFGDALAGSSLAKAYDAPILLTKENELPEATKGEIKRLGAKKAFILGETGVVTSQVAEELEALGVTVEARLGGANRYDTAASIAERVLAKTNANTAVVVNGKAYADGMTVGAYAGLKGYPVLYVREGSVPAETAKALEAVENVLLVGGTTVINSAVETELREDNTVEALREGHRVDTALAVAKKFVDSNKVIVASGEDYADALVASVLGAKNNAPIVLVKTNEIRTSVEDFIAEGEFEHAYVIGGVNSVSTTVEGKVKAALIAEEAELEVVSVSAINATQAEVTFSQEVDKTEAEDESLDLFTIGTDNPTNIKLSKDGKIATLTFISSIEGTNKAVVVEPITSQADDNVKSKRYAEVMTYKDTVKPVVTKIESITGTDRATSVKLTFSEPVASADTIKINGIALASGTNYTLVSGDTELVLSGLNLDATKSHTLEIVNLKDLATKANVTSYINETFKPVVDKVAPTVTSVEAKSDTALVFTFSKAVDLDDKQASTYVKLFDEDLVEKTSLLSTNNFGEVTGSKGTKFEVAINDPFVGNEKTKTLTAQIQDKVITDLQGNKVAKVNKNVTINKDEVAPTLTNAAFRTNNDGEVKELVFTFDEDVNLKTRSALTDLLADKSVNLENGVAGDLDSVFGTTPAGTFTVKDNIIKFVLTTAQDVSGKYNLEVAAAKVEDKSLAKNENKVQKFTLDFGAPKAEETFKVTSASGASNVITVNFDTPVKGGAGSGSATALSAYTLNGKALPAGTTITLNSAQNEAEITLPEGTIKDTDTAAIFVANSIVSKDGKKTLEKYTGTVGIVDNIAPEVTNAVLTSDNNIVVAFSEDVTEDISDFDIEINGVVSDATFTFENGTGSDVGKYIIDLSSLVKDKSTDTVLEILTDGSEDIILVAGTTGADVELSKSTLVNSIKLIVKNGTRNTVDGAGNTLKPGTEIVIK